MDTHRESPPRRFLTTVEAAAYLTLSPRSLERMRLEGFGPTYTKLGRLCRYALDDLDRWAEAGRRTPDTTRRAAAHD